MIYCPIKDVLVKPLDQFSDSRGFLFEIFRTDMNRLTLDPAMGYFSLTNAGTTRGPHEHESQTDQFVFTGVGSFVLHLWDNRKNSLTYEQKFFCVFDKPTLVIVPNGVVHAYTALSDGITLNFPDQLFAGVNKTEKIDEIRYENLPNCSFLNDIQTNLIEVSKCAELS